VFRRIRRVDEDILGKMVSRKGDGRIENKMSLDDVWKWEVTYFHEYWQVVNSKFSEQKTEKHDTQLPHNNYAHTHTSNSSH